MTLAYAEAEGPWTTPNGRPMSFAYRKETNDWNTLSASLGTNDEYGLRGMTFDGPVVDIGGYLGSVGISIAVDHPDVQVLMIEPVPYNAELIRQNIARNDVGDRVTLIEGAIGKGGEQVEVWYGYRGTESLEHHAFVGNSSLAYDHGGEAEHDSITYTALSLADLVTRLGPIDFLKIDCEGGEWAFLHGPALKKVRRIVGEAHAVRGHKGSDIVDLLSKTHDVTLTGDAEGTCEFAAVRR